MNADRLINIVAVVALVELMFAIGLRASVADVVAVARDFRGVALAAVANYVVVPAATVVLLLAFGAHPLVAAGFLVVAVCPGAPFGPPFTAVARGDPSRAVGLMVLLAGSSAVVAPLLLRLLVPVVAGDGAPLDVDAVGMVRTLAVAQFAPLAAGLAVSAGRPALAERWRVPAGRLSAILNLGLIGLVIVVQFDKLSAIRATGYLGMFLLWVASLGAGWVLGGRTTSERRTLAVTTAVRNVGVALVIVGGSFAGTAAVTLGGIDRFRSVADVLDADASDADAAVNGSKTGPQNVAEHIATT